MSFISKLKAIGLGALKVGNEIEKGIRVIEGFEPIVQKYVPAGITDKLDVGLADLDHVVKTIEVVGSVAGMNGKQKLDAAEALFTQLIAEAGTLSGHDAGDPSMVTEGIRQMISGWVSVQNGLKAK